MTGLLAAFDTEQALRRALTRLAEEHLPAETYTPHALEDRPKGSWVPLAMFAAGLGGFVFFFWLMSYADIWNYPVDIGGRPRFAWPAFVPIAFELGVLCAMGAGFLGFFLACRMPQLHEAVDECESFREASRDGWFVAIRSAEPARLDRARAVLATLDPAVVEVIP
jgi:hypothetical protein